MKNSVNSEGHYTIRGLDSLELAKVLSVVYDVLNQEQIASLKQV